jgi:hypothetical protein
MSDNCYNNGSRDPFCFQDEWFIKDWPVGKPISEPHLEILRDLNKSRITEEQIGGDTGGGDEDDTGWGDAWWEEEPNPNEGIC